MIKDLKLTNYREFFVKKFSVVTIDLGKIKSIIVIITQNFTNIK
jgi:hypothetical protein